MGWSFKKEISFWSKWQHASPNAEINLPARIRQFRKTVTTLPISFDTITDNPLTHGATYLRLQTQSSYQNKINLYADLFAEHRGVSYGIYNQKNIVVYPIVRLEAIDTLTIFKKAIEVQGKVGQFLDESLDAGLMIYNMDVQGFQVKANYKSYSFQYTLYGDLYGGIGLNIDDLKSYAIKKTFSDSGSAVGISYVSARPPYYRLRNYFNLNLFGNKQFRNLNLYGQIGFRPFSYQNYFSVASAIKRTAILLGAQGYVRKKKWEYNWKTELRYYGFLFNYEYYNTALRYRKPATDIYTMYANTVGNFLYPLRKFDSPFSQWAVFTEYINSNTGVVSLTGNYTYHISPKLDACLQYDINYIKTKVDPFFSPVTAQSNFLYPFYNIALGYKPADNLIVKAAITNKAMNLDVNYPTHYLFKYPQIELSLFASFK